MPPLKRKNIRAEQFTLADNQLNFFHRERFTIAQVNAGVTLLPAVANKKYRPVSLRMIAVGGGDPTGATDVRILGTRAATSVALIVCAIGANFTRSKLMTESATGSTILADGASFTDLDVNTGITVGKTGGALATSTYIDVMVEYQLIDQHVVATA